MDRKNNFDAIRLVAAAAVIYGHAHPLNHEPDLGFMSNSVQAFAVKVFFVISGYLICASWLSDPNIFRYLHRRLLRILPALCLTVLLTILVLGPLVTDLAIGDFLTQAGTWRYLFNIALYPIYDLPGVFLDNVYPVAVNGSLWSLPVEFAMYLILPIVLLACTLGKSRWLMVAITLAFALFALHYTRITPPGTSLVIYGTSIHSALDVAPYFLFGACFYRFRDKVKLDPIVALSLIGVTLLLQPAGAYAELVLMLVAPYAILAFATANTPYLRSAGKFGDISYGLYLYGFPVQQAVYHYTQNGVDAVQNTLIALPISAFFAWVSWHAVERRALLLKPNPKAAAKPTTNSPTGKDLQST